MTLHRMIELLEIEMECVRRNGCGECNRACHICDLLQDDTELHEMYAEVIARMKAQEPHVVTIADYKNNPNVDKDGNLAVWRESRHFNGIAYHEDGWIVLNRDRVEGWFNSEVIRFWTSRPDEKRRAETPWDC